MEALLDYKNITLYKNSYNKIFAANWLNKPLELASFNPTIS